MTPQQPPHAAPPVISLVNQKGGVGKTTTAAQVGHVLAEAGWHVLIIDMDTQANVTDTLVGDVGEECYTTAEIMEADMHGAIVEGCAASAIMPTGDQWSDRLHIIPGSLQLALRELDQVSARESRLKRALKGAIDDYDIVLIDCPPSLGQLTVNALVASQYVYIPTEPTRLGLKGVHLISQTIKHTTDLHNPSLNVAAILVTLYDARATEDKNRVAELSDLYGDLVYSEYQPVREVVNKAIGAAFPLSAYGSEGKESLMWYERFATHMTEQVADYVS